MPLARLASADYPLYGLQSRGLDGPELPGSIQEMAADYIDQIRGVTADWSHTTCRECPQEGLSRTK